MPKPKAPTPEIHYEEAQPLDTNAINEAFNFLFDKYFMTKGQSP